MLFTTTEKFVYNSGVREAGLMTMPQPSQGQRVQANAGAKFILADVDESSCSLNYCNHFQGQKVKWQKRAYYVWAYANSASRMWSQYF